MAIHLALSIYCPVRPQGKQTHWWRNYFYRLAESRLIFYCQQKGVTSATILVNPTDFDDEITRRIMHFVSMESHEWLPSNVRANVVIAHGTTLAHTGCGTLQKLVEANEEWTYFSEDGHTLPILKDSLARPLEQATKANPDADAIFVVRDRVRIWSNTFFPSNLDSLKQKEGLESSGNGHFQRTSTVKDGIYVPPTKNRVAHAMVLAYQGLKICGSSLLDNTIVHHQLDKMGYRVWRLFDDAKDYPTSEFAVERDESVVTEVQSQVEGAFEGIKFRDRLNF